jgi:hypothetical protein
MLYRIVISETADRRYRVTQAYDTNGMEAGSITQGQDSGLELFDVFDEQVESHSPHGACSAALNQWEGRR